MHLAREDFVKRFVLPKAGRTLVVGSRVYETREDRRKLFSCAEGWDMLPGEGVDRVIDLELEQVLPPVFDHVDCVSVLEHSRRPWLLAANLERLMKVGSTIYLTVPFIWRVHAYPDDYWRFTLSGIRALFTKIEWAAVHYAHFKIGEAQEKIPSVTVHDYPYMARTEVCGFGARI